MVKDFRPLAFVSTVPVTRRGFLAGAGAVAAGSVPRLARGQDARHRLTFHWNPERTVLTIRQIRPEDNPADLDCKADEWILPCAAFGPNARFLLQQGSDLQGATRYQLRVENAEFGRCRGRRIQFDFSSSNGGEFRIRMETTLWSRSAAPDQLRAFTLGERQRGATRITEGNALPVLFRDFVGTRCQGPGGVASANALTQWVANGRIASTFQLMFNGLITTDLADRLGQRGIELSFSADCIWRLQSNDALGPVRLIAVNGGVAMSDFSFGWCQDLNTNPGSGQAGPALDNGRGDAVLLGLGTPIAGPNGIKIHLPTATHDMDLTATALPAFEEQKPHPALFWIRAGHMPQPRLGRITSDTIEVEAALVGSWCIRLVEREVSERLDLPATGLVGVLRRRRALAQNDLRRITDRDTLIETRFDADFTRDGEFPVITPVGELLMRGEPTASDDDPRKPVLALGQSGAEWDSAAFAYDNHAGAAVRFAISRRVPGRDIALRWFEANMRLLECPRPLADTDYSRMRFASSTIAVVYSEDIGAPEGYGSYVSLTPLENAPLARIDLDRAHLLAGRAADLVHLGFRFRRMALELTADSASIVTLDQHCRVTGLSDDTFRDGDLDLVPPEARANRGDAASSRVVRTDDRAILVVEFPPQHVLEEAFFRPGLADPPAMVFANAEDSMMQFDEETKIDLTQPDQVMQALKGLSAVEKAALREKMLARFREKIPARKDREPFETMHDDYGKAARRSPNGLPADQLIYIGPYGFDADAAGIMRRTWEAIARNNLNSLADEVLDRARAAVKPLRDAAAARRASDNPLPDAATPRRTANSANATDLILTSADKDFSAALALETLIESAHPDYQLFRSFYRETMIDLFLGTDYHSIALKEALKSGIPPKPASLEAGEIEYVLPWDKANPENHTLAGGPTWETRTSRQELVISAYRLHLLGRDALPRLAEARLARPSRLAFHVNCRDRQSWLRGGVPELDRGPNDPDPGGSGGLDQDRSFGLRRLAFSLTALTNWAAFEMAVVRRAEMPFAPDSAGRLDVLSQRQSVDSGTAMLDHLGFPEGPWLSSAEWNAHLTNTLRDPPGLFETAIEMPARLVLSPNQTAVFLAPQPLPDRLRSPAGSPRKLWAARLMLDDSDPGVRAVYSPDLRPQVFSGSPDALPGHGAPPRGPLAPWLLDRYDSDADPVSPLALVDTYKEKFPADLGVDLTDDEMLCRTVLDRQDTGQKRLDLPLIIDQLCQRLRRRERASTALRFRSSLDAAIRHELVLLSSAHGMRVIGRLDAQGQVVGDSQFVPEPRHQLADLAPGNAIYKPPVLHVTELELTALGGSLRTQTGFEPPAGARTLDGKPLFPALSIERYQHWITLSRDIFVEVVFKGFLLPFGHRASLVQVTERRFEKDPDGKIACYLVQRMFIQRGTKTMRFPGLGQPFEGRALPFRAVSLLAERSPDIIDPYDDVATNSSTDPAQAVVPGPTGRLRLPGNAVGLAFWPRTAKTPAANIRFELELDGLFSTLPMLFVDSTAANDETTLAQIVKYYRSLPNPHDNRDDAAGCRDVDAGCKPDDMPQRGAVPEAKPIDPIKYLSTLLMGGGKLRFADENKTGSASLDTESLTLTLTGGDSHNTPLRLKGSTPAELEAADPIVPDRASYQLQNFHFAPILQGVDRIPAYPAMRSARVHLRQNERLTGLSGPPVRAQYDSRYLEFGLPGSSGLWSDAGQAANAARTEKVQNASEVFLVLIDHPAQNLGARGNQSGGLARPETNLVAMSRLNGPMGIGKIKSATGPDRDRLCTPLLDPCDLDQFHEVAPLFHVDEAPAAPAAVQAQGVPPPATGKNQKNQILALYDRYFSDDAKLLGLISLKKLFKLVVDLNGDPALMDPRTGVPKLNELIQYGAGKTFMDADGTLFLREHVVAPLDDMLQQIIARWEQIDIEIREKQGALNGISNPITLAQILPDLDRALRDLGVATNQALTETSDVLFALALGTVFEAGTRVVDTIGRTLSRIDEIAAEAIGNQIDQIVSFFNMLIDGFPVFVQRIGIVLLKDRLEDAGANEGDAQLLSEAILNGSISGDDREKAITRGASALAMLVVPAPDDVPFAQFPVPPLMAGSTLPEDLWPRRGEIRALVQDLLVRLLDGQAVEMSEFGNVLNQMQVARINAVLNQNGLSGEMVARIELYRHFLTDPATVLPEQMRTQLENSLRSAFGGEIRLIQQSVQNLTAMREGIRTGNLLAALNQFVEFIQLFAGPIGLESNPLNAWQSVFTHLSNALALPDMRLCQGIDPEAGVCPPVQPDNSHEIPEAFRPKSGDGDDPSKFDLCRSIWNTRSRLEELRSPLERFKADLDDFLKKSDAAAVLSESVLQKLTDDLAKVIRVRENLQLATDQTFCDFVNDARLFRAVADGWNMAVQNLVDPADINKSIERLANLSNQFELLLRSRQRMIETLAWRVRDMAVQLRTLVESEFLVESALLAILKSQVSDENSIEDLRTKAQDEFESANTRFIDLTLHAESMLWHTVHQLRNTVLFLQDTLTSVETLASVGASQINDLLAAWNVRLDSMDRVIQPLNSIVAYLDALRGNMDRALLDSAATQDAATNTELLREQDASDPTDPPKLRLSRDRFKMLGADRANARLPLLDFASEMPDILAEFNGTIDQQLTRLNEKAREYLTPLRQDVLEAIDGPVQGALSATASLGDTDYKLAGIYAQVKRIRDDIHATMNSGALAELRRQIVVADLGPARRGDPRFPPSDNRVIIDTDRLAADVFWLDKLGREPPVSEPTKRAFLTAFLTEWSSQQSTPHLIARQVTELLTNVLRGEVLALIPLDEIRNQIEDRILELVPSKITQGFSLGTAVPPEVEGLTAGIFMPGPDCRLAVGMSAEIDLLGDKPAEFTAKGSLGPFDIKLVGDYVDALTLHFSGARFDMKPGSQMEFDVGFRDFTIGEQLSFVEMLAQYLSPGGSGPYVAPAQGRPGIEAGYGLDIGMFTIGNLSFSNISLNASAVLPFDDSDTRFRASLSRRDAPFTLAYAPYGGSGFFAIDANANGIQGFEASFEFGGAGAFAIGPLTGQGRIMAGFYIRQIPMGNRKLTEMQATVFVGGSANIWIFSFSSALNLRMGMVGGAMTGEATFTFSFSMGIKDFDYSVQWKKQESQGWGGDQNVSDASTQQKTLLGPGHTRLAGPIVPAGGLIENRAICQSNNWATYSGYFDPVLDQEEYLNGRFI